MKRYAPLILSLVVLAALLLSSLPAQGPVRSVELGIAEHSPLGFAGGMVVPASCPSYDHTHGPNACAPCNGPWIPAWGYDRSNQQVFVDTCDACPGNTTWDGASCVPNCVAGTGNACVSAANSCGQTRSNGTMQCNGTCTSTPPPLSDCPPTVTVAGPGGTPGPTANVIVGQTATITWSCPSSGNTSASGVNFSTGGAVSGSTGVVVTADKTYTVVCD
ncbi:hypothetical protein K2Q00_03845, partial [Patescibacteria group bacterium]|nr:hypothetical protein [Patescibacteria group bacterium]